MGREPRNDKPCDELIQHGSGFCECDGGERRGLSACGHRELRCKDICAGNYPFCWDNWEGQKSGAYIFRPNSSEFRYPGPSGKPSLRILEGDVVTEVHQIYSDWVSHVIRLVKGEPYIEVEWTVGPIPTSTPWITEMDGDYGKEVAVRYEAGLNSMEVFHTDSNGRVAAIGWYWTLWNAHMRCVGLSRSAKISAPPWLSLPPSYLFASHHFPHWLPSYLRMS